MPRSSRTRHEEDDEGELAAFTTYSKAAAKQTRAAAGRGHSSAPPLGTTLVPFMGDTRTAVEDIELSDVNASVEQHLVDSENLLSLFDSTVNAHESLVAKAVGLTKQRFAAEKRTAVEAATLAAMQTTERRMGVELRVAVASAVGEAAAVAKAAQDVAVAEAVRRAEERATEQQRLAMLSLRTVHQRELGVSEDQVLASATAASFQEAASAASAALAASSQLLARDVNFDVDRSHPAVDATRDGVERSSATRASAQPASTSPPSLHIANDNDELHFF